MWSEILPVVSDSLQPHGILQARILEWITFHISRGSSQPRDQTQVSHIAGGFFTGWATREAQEYGVGSLALLQWIFLTQDSNPGVLHCRQVLYQLSYQASPGGHRHKQLEDCRRGGGEECGPSPQWAWAQWPVLSLPLQRVANERQSWSRKPVCGSVA